MRDLIEKKQVDDYVSDVKITIVRRKRKWAWTLESSGKTLARGTDPNYKDASTSASFALKDQGFSED